MIVIRSRLVLCYHRTNSLWLTLKGEGQIFMWHTAEENVACCECVCLLCLINCFKIFLTHYKFCIIPFSPTLHLKFFCYASLDTFCLTCISVMGRLEQDTNRKVRLYWFRQWFNAFSYFFSVQYFLILCQLFRVFLDTVQMFSFCWPHQYSSDFFQSCTS